MRARAVPHPAGTDTLFDDLTNPDMRDFRGPRAREIAEQAACRLSARLLRWSGGYPGAADHAG